MKYLLAVLLLAGRVPLASGQTGDEAERWAAFEFFAGAWVGEESATFDEVFDLTLPGRTESITIRGRWTRNIP